MAATGGEDAAPSAADAPPLPSPPSGPAAPRTVVLDDEKVAFFMAMAAYFSNQFVDTVRVIERLAKKTVERVVATDEFVPVLARADDRKYTQRDLEAREREYDRQQRRLREEEAQGIDAKPCTSPPPPPEAAPEAEEKRRGRVRTRLRTRRKRAATVPDHSSSGFDAASAAAASPAAASAGAAAAGGVEEGEVPETPLLSTREQELASLELEPGALKYNSEHLPREPSFESAAALHAASRVTRDDSSAAPASRPRVPRVSHRHAHRHHRSRPKSPEAAAATVAKEKDVSAGGGNSSTQASQVSLPDESVVRGLGPCELVWGPACFQAPLSLVADNTMFVVRYRAAPQRLVVAIAGTHPLSLTNWVVHDMNVKPVVWPYTAARVAEKRRAQRPLRELHEETVPLAHAGQPGVTAGTLQALRVLLAMRDPATQQSLPVLLAGAADAHRRARSTAPCEVTVTGHSLGGALCTALALYLECTHDTWDPHRCCTVRCVSFAAPAVGNAAFAALYDAALGATTRRVHNSHDIVALAWTQAGLARIATVYEPAIRTPSVIAVPVQVLRRITARHHYTHVCADQPGFVFGTPDPKRNTDFMDEVVWQHNIVYFTYFGMGDIFPIFADHNPLLASLFVFFLPHPRPSPWFHRAAFVSTESARTTSTTSRSVVSSICHRQRGTFCRPAAPRPLCLPSSQTNRKTSWSLLMSSPSRTCRPHQMSLFQRKRKRRRKNRRSPKRPSPSPTEAGC